MQNPKISKIINFNSWKNLAEIRKNEIIDDQHEGLMIKSKYSPYISGRPKGHWYKWKKDPKTVDAILMYAVRGHGKRSSYYSDFTFGCWTDKKREKLVPIGKAYSGFTNDELKDPFSAKSNNNLSEFSIMFCPFMFKSLILAVSIVCSEILINSRLTNIS